MNPAQNAATIGRNRKLHYNNKIASSWLAAAQMEFTHFALSDPLSIRPPSMSMYLVCVSMYLEVILSSPLMNNFSHILENI